MKVKQATVPTKKQILQILRDLEPKECGKRDSAIILLTCTTGLRVTEVSRVTVKDVFTKNQGIRQECTLRPALTKNKKSRCFYPSNKLLQKHLLAYVAHRIAKGHQLGNPDEYMGLQTDMPL